MHVSPSEQTLKRIIAYCCLIKTYIHLFHAVRAVLCCCLRAGNELCLLSEGISALPHSPAPSLQQAGVLPQLLLDSCAAPIDYVNVAAVIRSEADISPSRQSSEKSLKAVQNSLHSFRVVTSDS